MVATKEKRRFRWILLLLLLTGVANVALYYLSKDERQRWRQFSEKTALQVGETIADKIINTNTPLSEANLTAVFSIDPNIAYLIVEQKTLALRTGVINPEAMNFAPFTVRKRLLNEDFSRLAEELMQIGKGGARSGFEVMQIELVDEKNPRSAPQTIVKMGYVAPTYLHLKQLSMISQLLLILVLFVTVRLGLRSARSSQVNDEALPRLLTDKDIPAAKSSDLQKDENKEEIDLMSLTLPDQDSTEIISLRHPMHLGDEKWINMLSEEGLSEWQRRGSWYVINDYIIATPWRASLTRSDFNFKDYAYRVKAKATTGADGFVILFTCDGQSYVWVLGGWNNSRSEVAGLEATRHNRGIEKNRWYEVTVEVLPETICGYLNTDRQWSVERQALKGGDFSKDFLPGIGVATWSAVCKFKDPMIVDKSSQAAASEAAPNGPVTVEETEIVKIVDKKKGDDDETLA